MLELKTYPEQCLRIKTKKVEDFQKDLSGIIRQMIDIMYINNGIGLAATQVGLNESFLVMDAGEGAIPLVNPEIIEYSKEKSHMEEGCLSLPGVAVTVARSKEIAVKAQDEEGKEFTKKFSGLTATVVQHEMDHLNGKLLIDYLNPFKHMLAAAKLSRNKKKR
jgi:peptide deformylase